MPVPFGEVAVLQAVVPPVPPVNLGSIVPDQRIASKPKEYDAAAALAKPLQCTHGKLSVRLTNHLAPLSSAAFAEFRSKQL